MSIFCGDYKGVKMIEDPRLSLNKVRVPRRDNYEKRSVLRDNSQGQNCWIL